MVVKFTRQAKKDYRYWREYDPEMADYIDFMVEETKKHPTTGEGRPKKLHAELAGNWARTIDEEHRMVYSFEEDEITFKSLRFHYPPID